MIKNNRWMGYLLVGSAVLLSGCEKVYYSQIISEGAYLETPSGNYPFRNITKKEAKMMRLYRSDFISSSYLMAESPNIIVIFCGQCVVDNIIIAGTQYSESITLPTNKATYQLNGSSGAAFSRYDGTITTKFIWSLPSLSTSNKAKYKYTHITSNQLKKTESKVHLIHKLKIPFKVGNDSYTAHINVSKKRKFTYKYKFSVPGTP